MELESLLYSQYEYSVFAEVFQYVLVISSGGYDELCSFASVSGSRFYGSDFCWSDGSRENGLPFS